MMSLSGSLLHIVLLSACCAGQSPDDIRYEKALNAALNAKRDIWGETLIARAEGPTYENIVEYLRPMLWIGDYVTTSGVYYLVFGPVSFTIRSQLDDGLVEAEVMPPSRQSPRRLNLRFRVPVTHKLQSIHVNGHPHAPVDAASATVNLSGLTGTIRITAKFTPE